MLIHFPIALLMVGFLAEVVSLFTVRPFFRQAAIGLLVIGVCGAIAAYITGNIAGDGIESGPLKAPMELHEQAALVTMLLGIATALFKGGMIYLKMERVWTKVIGLLLYLALVAGVARTGFLGGQLVFSHGAGVHLALPDFSNPTIED